MMTRNDNYFISLCPIVNIEYIIRTRSACLTHVSELGHFSSDNTPPAQGKMMDQEERIYSLRLLTKFVLIPVASPP